MPRTLSDEDIDAVAHRVVLLIGKRLATDPIPAAPIPPAPSQVLLPPKLAFTLKELSVELGISKVSLYRLEARGLLKPLPYLRTKIYSRQEVERFLSGKAG